MDPSSLFDMGLIFVVAVMQLLAVSGLEKEAFFQGDCIKWNPCSQMCINVLSPDGHSVDGFECRCAKGYILNQDGVSCDEILLPSSTLPPEIQELDAIEPAQYVKIHHSKPASSVNDLTKGVYNNVTNSFGVSKQEYYLNQVARQKSGDKYGDMLGDDPNAGNQDQGTINNEDDIDDVDKKWVYNDPNNFRPKTYYNANSHRRENYVFDGKVTQAKSSDRNRSRNKNKGSGRRKTGKGRKGSKSRTKAMNEIDYDTTQSDSAVAGKMKYIPGLSNEVLEDEFKTKADYIPYSKPVEFENCNLLRCKNGGRCVSDDMRGGVRCQCKLGNEGKFCENDVMVKFPQFKGTGYMAFPVLKGAYREFSITLEFRPDTFNGLLLFSSDKPNAETDFFSVALVDERIEFRFDCGSGMAIIESSNKVTLGEWNTLTVHRVEWNGWLQLNDGPKAAGRSMGFFKRITFREDLYLGGYRNLSLIGRRTSNTGMQWGFVGCVRHLEVNDKVYDMRKGLYTGDALHGIDVGECSAHTCDNVGCLNGGRCQADSADTSVCLCPFGSAGDRCETKIDVEIPSFDGTSYLQFVGLRRNVLMFTKIEVVFKPVDKDGLLLYNGYRTDRTGDFLSLALADGYLEFRFDLGTGPAVIRSMKRVTMNEWHSVRVERTARHGVMVVDNEAGVNGMAKGGYTQLTLTLDLFIGGHRNFDEIAKSANIQTAFKGCIQKLVINDSPIKLVEDYIEGANIENCNHPCTMAHPCLNGGRCIPLMANYECSCPLGYESDNCERRKVRYRYRFKREIREPVKVPMFTGNSFLMYNQHAIMQRIKGSKVDIQMRIRATNPDGLLLWAGEEPMGASSDYLAVGLDHGHAIMRYNLGSGDIVISYNGSRLDDGKWHKIRAQRYHKVGYLEIDGTEIVEGTSPGTLQQLNVAQKLYIGGMSIDKIAHSTLNKFTKGFTGCISNVTLATEFHIDLMDDVKDGENIHQCKLKT